MVREFTCIICPNGCEITAELEKTEDGACRIRSIEGAACKRGTHRSQKKYRNLHSGRGRRTTPYQCPPHGPHTQGKDF